MSLGTSRFWYFLALSWTAKTTNSWIEGIAVGWIVDCLKVGVGSVLFDVFLVWFSSHLVRLAQMEKRSWYKN